MKPDLNSILVFGVGKIFRKYSLCLFVSCIGRRLVASHERATRLGQLAGSLAHELNQPLAAIFNGARAALRFLKADKMETEVLEDILRNIVEDEKRAASVVRNAQNMLKRRDQEKKPVAIDRIVDEVVAIFRSEASARRIEIETRHENKSPRVVGNDNQIRQVLLNLIMDAADAVSSRNVEDRKIVLTTRMDENWVEVSVRDFGQGIDSERIGKIFVIDDDESMRRSLMYLLHSMGYCVETFSSAESFLKRQDFDGNGCILLDVRMPGMSGTQLQDLLRKEEYHMPIVFITSYGELRMGIQAMKKGALDFLTKPFDDEELLRAIQHALEKDRRARVAYLKSREIKALLNKLSRREFEVFRYVAAGMPNKNIAYALQIAEPTVKIHRRRIMKKLNASTFAHLVRIAENAGIDTDDLAH